MAAKKRMCSVAVLAALIIAMFGSCSKLFNGDIDEEYEEKVNPANRGELTVSDEGSTDISDYTVLSISADKEYSCSFEVTSGSTYYIQWASYYSNSSLLTNAGYTAIHGQFSVYDSRGYVVNLYYDDYGSSSDTSVSSYSLVYFTAAYSGTYTVIIQTYSTWSSSGSVALHVYEAGKQGKDTLNVFSKASDDISGYAVRLISAGNTYTYSFPVTSGETYYIQWASQDSNSSLLTNSDYTAAGGRFSVYDNNGSEVKLYYGDYELYAPVSSYSPVHFTAASSDTYTITVEPCSSSSSPGYVALRVYSYGVSEEGTLDVHSESSYDISGYTTLQISAGEKYSYSFTVASGSTYYIQWLDSDCNSTLLTNSGYTAADGQFSVSDSSGNSVILYTSASDFSLSAGGSALVYLTASSDDTYTLTIQTSSSSWLATGYVGVRICSSVSTTSTSSLNVYTTQASSFTSYARQYIVPEHTYNFTFDATQEMKYYIQWIDSESNSSLLTNSGYTAADGKFSVYDSSGTVVTVYSSSSSSYTSVDSASQVYFTAASAGTYTITVQTRYSYSFSGYVALYVYQSN